MRDVCRNYFFGQKLSVAAVGPVSGIPLHEELTSKLRALDK